MSLLEIVGVVTGILGVWLTTRQKIWCWPVGMLSVVAFIGVFFRAKLYASMGLQCVYVGLQAYGWYAWLHGGEAHGALRVSNIAARLAVLLVSGGAVVTVAMAWWLGRRTDEALPFLDAFTTTFSLIAQWMQTRKHLENWILWIVVDIVYVGMYLSQGLALTSGLYVVFVGLAIVGYRDWRRSMRAAEARA